MCEAYTAYEVGAALALLAIDPRLWQDIASTLVHRKFNVKDTNDGE
jgi:hypothetical protein